MAFASFEVITAAKLNRIQPVTYTADGTALATPTLTTTEVDIPSATYTLSTSAANAIYVVTATFDMFATSVGATLQGRLSVDGSTVGGSAIWTPQAANDRTSVPWIWRGTLALAGSHTLKLRGVRDFASGTQQIASARLIITITEVV